jgi:inorganic triphosphatase YgiF
MTDDAPQEIEAKFEVDAAERDALLRAERFDDWRVVSRNERAQHDLYFDTAERALRAAGATLRVRTLPDSALVTFKGARQPGAEAHVATRLEDEAPAPAEWAERVAADHPLPDGAPLGPLTRARAIAGAAPLLPVARLRNERATVRLTSGVGEVELALDRCHGERLADGRQVAFDEAELEVKQGGAEALRAAQTALRAAAPGLQPSTLTKLERVLG